MHEDKLRAQIHHALDARLSGLKPDPRLAQRVMRAEKEPKMKKKATAGFVFAVIVLLALTGAALAVSLNLIDLLGEKSERFAVIAPDAVALSAQPVTVRDERFEDVTISLSSAYYDGESLVISYMAENGEQWTPHTPDAKELAGMLPLVSAWSDGAEEKLKPEDFAFGDSEAEQAIAAAYLEALAHKKPFGWITYEAILDVTRFYGQEKEKSLGGGEGHRVLMENGRTGMVWEFYELSPEMRFQDSAEVHMPVGKNIRMYYYDGEKLLFSWEQVRDAALFSVIIPRSEAPTRRFTGETEVDGVPAQVVVDATPLRIFFWLKAKDAPFHEMDADGDLELDLYMLDSLGNELDVRSWHWGDDHTQLFTVEGTGQLPEGLQAWLVLTDYESVYASAEITLTPAE